MSTPPTVLIPSDANSADGHRSRLRERFLNGGLAAFAEYEVVELLLTLAIPRRDVKPQAKALLARFGSIKNILEANLEDLTAVDGMGEVAPVALHIIRAAVELYLRQSAEGSVVLNNYAALEAFWRARLSPLHNEVIEIAYLDHAYKLMENGVERLEEGAIDSAALSSQKLFKRALQKGARYLVLAHNHPTGVATPSAADESLTTRIATVAEGLELTLLDHWIIAGQEVYSFRRAGKL